VSLTVVDKLRKPGFNYSEVGRDCNSEMAILFKPFIVTQGRRKTRYAKISEKACRCIEAKTQTAAATTTQPGSSVCGKRTRYLRILIEINSYVLWLYAWFSSVGAELGNKASFK